MALRHRELLAISLLLLLAFSASCAAAGDAAPAAIATKAAPPKLIGKAKLTGKEKLGRKWTDEQRIDNCKVPLDKRGTKPRPSACPDDPPG